MPIDVKGSVIDSQTRCSHYHSVLDVIAIKFRCCGQYYPCFLCHSESQNHTIERWQSHEFDTQAILCGVCQTTMTIQQYFDSNARCPNCEAAFNPKCSNHYYLYFEI